MKMQLGLKRIESSVDSFRLTLENIISQIYDAVKAIMKNEEEVYSGIQANDITNDVDWDSDWGDEENIIGRKVKVRISDMDTTRWLEDLSADLRILEDLLESARPIKDENDLKLVRLKQEIAKKIENPLNPDNRKIIIFTAFADTANYLYKCLKDYLKETYQINTALITGSKRSCTSKNIPTDLNVLLTCFSPLSKGKSQIIPNIKESIDVLIATDCISEGQNLQDCDYLVNYDIHWNPVRIIQRFGRIDRIGSKNSNITLVNFWPDVTLDAYINLKQRVESRMLISNMASTGDDNILNSEEKDLEYRKIQLKKLKEEVVDLEDLREGVSITDLGLNDFRIDLSNYIKTFGELKNIPEGLHAVTSVKPNTEKGVIFILKNINSQINIDKLNRLHPYYLVFIKESGEIIYNHADAKKTLDSIRLVCKGINEPLVELCQNFSDETNEYREMDLYSGLLQKSISSILKTEEEKDILSLFKAGGTTALQSKIKGIEDFKLISFVVIK